MTGGAATPAWSLEHGGNPDPGPGCRRRLGVAVGAEMMRLGWTRSGSLAGHRNPPLKRNQNKHINIIIIANTRSRSVRTNVVVDARTSFVIGQAGHTCFSIHLG